MIWVSINSILQNDAANSITDILGSFSSYLIAFPVATFQCGRYDVVIIWENDPKIIDFTQSMKAPLAYVSCCIICHTCCYKTFTGSNPIGSKVFFLLLSTFFITIHGYNELYYVRHKLETIKDWKFRLRIKCKTKKGRHRPDSYLQSAGYESRVLTNTPRGQRDFEAKFNKSDWTLKPKIFGETSPTAWYSALWVCSRLHTKCIEHVEFNGFTSELDFNTVQLVYLDPVQMQISRMAPQWGWGARPNTYQLLFPAIFCATSVSR